MSRTTLIGTRLVGLSVAALAGVFATDLLAQAPAPAPPAPAAPAEAAPAEPVLCAPKLALYTGAKKARILVRRTGSGNAVDPLRPLTPRPVVVLELVVDGRTAYAAGPSLTLLKRAALGEIEADHPVVWEKPGALPPRLLRLVTEDGRAPFGDLVFSACQDAPAVRPAATRRANPDRPAADRRPAPKLPQGAIPDNSLKLSPR